MTTWIYPRCHVVHVYDGDTITVDIDLGQDIWVRRRSVRLSGIAARELRDLGGLEARDNLRVLLPVDTLVTVVSTGWDKYAGRIIGLVASELVEDVGQELVRTGWASPWDGRGAQPRPAWPRLSSP